MKGIPYTLLFISAFLTQTCIEPYSVENIDYEKLLVVDGLITNEYKNHRVTLSYSSELTNPVVLPENQASVRVANMDGEEIGYSSIGQGIYESVEPFAGEPGASYQLTIEVGEKTYVSDWVELIPSPEIDSIYWGKTRLPVEVLNENLDGVQFYIDTHDESGRSTSYRYEWEEGYRNDAPYISTHYVAGDTILPREEQISLCYSENQSSEIIVGTSLGVAENRIAQQPIRFITERDRHLNVKYALLVRQYAITEEAFHYYRRLKEINESGGSLFDKQQGPIQGNIHSSDDAFEPVLGYFEVSGVSQLRRFFGRRAFGIGLKVGPYPNACFFDETEVEFGEAIDLIADPREDLEIWYVFIPNMGLGPPTAFLVPKSCSHCLRLPNTSLTPPDYWIE